MPKRILEYCTEIMRTVEKKGHIDYQREKIPTIYPIVLYTGNGHWKVPKNLTQLQEKLLGIDPLIEVSYILVEACDYTKDELIKDRSSISKAILMEKIRNKKELLEVLEQVVQEPLNKEEKMFISDLLVNVAKQAIGDEKSKELLEKMLGKDGDGMLVENLARIYREGLIEEREIGMKQGFKDGVSNGISQGIRQVAVQMVKSKMSDKTIKAMTKISDEELQNIKSEVALSN